MKLHSFFLKNFRRLKATHIDLEDDISIFVGANNSGKTSATQAIEIFINGNKEKFSIFDFSSHQWNTFNEIGTNGFTEQFNELPIIYLDLWFDITAADMGKAYDLLPGLDWAGSLVGLRITFQPKDPSELLERYGEAKAKVAAYMQANPENVGIYSPWPSNLVSYLETELNQEYELGYYKLDRTHFDDKFLPNVDFAPMRFSPEKGKALVRSLIRVDGLNAQRHLSDVNSHARAEDLSKCLSRFYKRNLEKREDDHNALRALSESEAQLNDHLAKVFEKTLDRLSALGYPGFSNPTLIIKSALNPTTIMNQDTRVHYSLGGDDTSLTLPDNYNGLGFKNLIYMVVEILDLQARWIEDEENRALLHLIFIEEPEAHLHAQLQQVFIRKVLSLLDIDGEDPNSFRSQVIITTHSPHILYERGFKPIRYFRRNGNAGVEQFSECLNLSQFYQTETVQRDFLEKYLKLTHCDLFFADATILVEGNVERLLVPLMIKKVAPKLQSSYLSILEVGGAFAHRFKSLIEFLGITTLVITDIDSVLPPAAGEAEPQEADEIDDDADDNVAGKTCMITVANAVTSNQTLRTWLPRKTIIQELLVATPEEKTQEPNENSNALIRVAYQVENNVVFSEVNGNFAGRTLEEAFGLENASWCQADERKALGLRFNPQPATIAELAEKLHKRVKGTYFNKTNFALNVLAENEGNWDVPKYIADGLEWLEDQISVEAEEIVQAAEEIIVAAEGDTHE